MAVNPINPPLPADLPENWQYGQTVAPNGADVGLAEQYGYNYLMQQVNAAQEGVNTLGQAVENLPTNSISVQGSGGVSTLPEAPSGWYSAAYGNNMFVAVVNGYSIAAYSAPFKPSDAALLALYNRIVALENTI